MLLFATTVKSTNEGFPNIKLQTDLENQSIHIKVWSPGK